MNLQNYFNRFDPSKQYDEVMFRAGFILQSAELNEIQAMSAYRARGIADALFKDGDVIRDAALIVDDLATGDIQLQSGAIYLDGAVRGVPSATLRIPVVGNVAVGVYLLRRVITEVDDQSLRDPATGVRNYGEAGAARLQAETSWGYAGDGQIGEFYPVYQLDDMVLRIKEPPPQLDSVTQALARYDRDNSGGTYVVSGLSAVQAMIEGENQVFLVSEGRARVNGFAVELGTSRRVTYPAVADLLTIDAEPHVSTGVAAQRVNVDRGPIGAIQTVRITAEKTVTLTHGAFVGAADALPDTSIVQIIEVKQGATTYVQGTDYRLQGGAVDWSLSGAEPTTGSSYTVKYRYITQVTPTAVDSDGFTVTGAVVDTLILVTYTAKLPRIDVLYLRDDGGFDFVQGQSTIYSPVAPDLPAGVLGVATIYQTWRAAPTVRATGLRMVSMSDLQRMNSRIDTLTDLIAENRLTADINSRDAAATKGIFVDSFRSDSQRDAGIAQDAAIIAGELTLPVAAVVERPSSDTDAPVLPSFTHEVALSQTLRTGKMLVNPYQAFDPVPAEVTISPSFDRWSVVNDSHAGSITERLVVGGGVLERVLSVETVTQVLSQTTRSAPFLRPIRVTFTVRGFGPNENLARVRFDGIEVTAS